MRLASVDIGTNSSLLLITDAEPDRELRIVEERFTTTRLGAGVAAAGELRPEAMARTSQALEAYARDMDEHDVQWRGAVGTAALRDAKNGALFREDAACILGCPVEVISGQREAQLMVAGISGSFGPLPGRALMLDIGGGSTELVATVDGQVDQLASLPLGAVRLTEQSFASDPATREDLAATREMIRHALAALPDGLLDADRLVGTAGTITTLATIHLGMDRYDTARVNGLELTLEQVDNQIALFAAASLEERQRIPGLDPGRADIILAGALILREIMGGRFPRLRICDRGVRWGLQQEALAAIPGEDLV